MADLLLDKTKLILGNGLDLNSGFPTRYSDFFTSREPFDNLSFISQINGEISNLFNLENNQHKLGFFNENDFKYRYLSKTTIWDVFFCLESQMSSLTKWRDIEDKIAKSLLFAPKADYVPLGEKPRQKQSEFVENQKSENDSYWGTVFKAAKSGYIGVNSYTQNIRRLCEFYANIIYSKIPNIYAFYEFLLKQLKIFENRFGKYIEHVFDKDESKEKQRNLIAKFPIDISSIDTFNFHKPILGDKEIPVRFINGDSTSPIFGFDCSTLRYSDPRFIFTKTYRHLEQSVSKPPFVPDNEFQNAFVYGHSLSKNDYNYFFPILDHLNMTDINAYNNRICFAYSVYDKNNEETIKKDFLNSVGTLIESYADYKGVKEKSRLLDQLSVSGKIFMYEVKD